MELKDFNLGMATIKKPGYYTAFGLYPINDCIFNGERYQGNSEEPTEENMYLRTKGLEHGCIMSIEQTQKAYIIKKDSFWGALYIDIWEIPYKSEGYTDEDKFRVFRSEKLPIASFECK